ncbi:hypothetical protein ACFP9V_03565 [Deinococcus radiopugnans]|uniref:Uncharacterized protein n=1 Tax=Deinococcus radiopugnans ATCC 19172 TaxID=585398 RepID=A0A5C4Y6V1_9DEIO|nr:hypothetical protein [Deinococcus radiopugnans]MBB6016991.1 hypothetical protein [Deinococcus radiopugnans ATCC 19172]TNM71534.1 hypothetical protein FHR04_08300 [Deinococcus radiopugnans ATCC 19172]
MIENPTTREMQAGKIRRYTDNASSPASLNWILCERRVIGTLLSVSVFLILMGFIFQMSMLYLPKFLGRDMFWGLFNLNGESNIPAAFSALLLMLATLILGVISGARRQIKSADASAWRALTLIFGFLALDEAAGLHERTANIVNSIVKTDGILFYAWVIPYGTLTLVVGLAFLQFMRQLPATIRNRIILAGAIYIVGALGMEVLEAKVVSNAGTQNFLNQGLIVIEEGMEMLGVTLFIGALLRYVRLYLPDLQLRVSVAPATPLTPRNSNDD